MGNSAYVDEKTERVRKYIERLNDQGGLASLRETIVDVMERNDADMDQSWAKFRLEEVDLFSEHSQHQQRCHRLLHRPL